MGIATEILNNEEEFNQYKYLEQAFILIVFEHSEKPEIVQLHIDNCEKLAKKAEAEENHVMSKILKDWVEYGISHQKIV